MARITFLAVAMLAVLAGILAACESGNQGEENATMPASCEPPLVKDEAGNCVQQKPVDAYTQESEKSGSAQISTPPPLPPEDDSQDGPSHEDDQPMRLPDQVDDEDDDLVVEDRTQTSSVLTFTKPGSTDIDLSSFPEPFFDGSIRNYSLVRSNDSSGVGCQINLAGAIDSLKAKTYDQEDLVKEEKLMQMASENLIILGYPCVNQLAAQILGNPVPCDKGLETGKGYAKLYSMKSHYALLIMGNTSSETVKACKQIGAGMKMEGTTYEFAVE